VASDAIYRLQGAYECDMAGTPDGWVLAAVCMEDVDGRFVSNMDADREWEDIKALMLPGATYDDWTRAYTALRPTLNLLESRSGNVRTLHTASAEQFSGIAVTGGSAPAFIWTDLDEDRWSVRLHRMGESSLLHTGPQVLLSPSIARDSDDVLWWAWVSREEDEDVVHLTDEDGRRGFEVPGRNPCLVALPGGVAVCYERPKDGESHIYYSAVVQGSLSAPVRVSSRNPLNFRPRCITDSDGHLLVTWESSPAWGFDIQVDQVREIELRRIDPKNGRVDPGHGTGEHEGVIPIPFKAYERAMSQVHAGENRLVNMTPSNPRLLRIGEKIFCSFRVVHPIKTRKYADPEWIVGGGLNPSLPYRDSDLSRDSWTMCVIEWDGKSWSEPKRVTESEDFDSREVGNEGFSHHQYGLAAWNDTPLVACHCFNNYQYPPRDHRVEVLPIRDGLSRIHAGVRTFDAQPVHVLNPPMEVPELPDGPSGLRLVFGDLHVHTSHSSCMPALDGNPPDNIRLQRDVLGYEVICLADHHCISDSDFRQRLDLLQREQAGGHVPIYGLEWNKRPWQHINFFTYDKEIMKELRQILHKDLDLQLLFDEIMEKYPEKVAAIRHFHDRRDTHTYLYDARVEWAMEILCGRGDRMATEEDMFGGITQFPFPVNFIEWKDAKLGLIGASDHHMTVLGACLTGFWVDEVSGEAVFDALRNRRTIACANGKLAMWVHSNGVGMGQVGRGESPVEIKASVASALPIRLVSFWADGRWVRHQVAEPGQTQFSFVDDRAGEGEHYYIVRAETQRSPQFPKGPIIGYSSPLWLTIE